ncbi:MAG: bifunctional acetate--CoA ligase family protein/GNAT family N-acetyltransferase [Thiolinea sp.]
MQLHHRGFRYGYHYLTRLITPGAIAVFGHPEHSPPTVATVLNNLSTADFQGKRWLINAELGETSVFDYHVYPDLAAVPGKADLAVIATAPGAIHDCLHQCGENGVRHVVLLTDLSSEPTAKRRNLEQKIRQAVGEYGLYLLGPNTLGIMNPERGLNASCNPHLPMPGSMALVSQSGAVCAAMLDWAASRKLGFSSVITLGDGLGLNFGQILDYLALDPHTHSILLYIESIRDARSFMSGLRAASRIKPVIVLKAGRHEQGKRAVFTHTGALVGEFAAFEAALQRAGVVQVQSITQLFNAAEILSSGMQVRGSNRLLIITNGGGPGIMATDRAAERGVQLSEPGDAVLKALNQVLPFAWSRGNPVDILGDATPERYEQALNICLQEDSMDGVLVMLTPQALTDPEGVAEALVRVKHKTDKPVLACWMGGARLDKALEILTAARIPYFTAPEPAVEAFAFMASYHNNQKLLMQVPASVETLEQEPDIKGAHLIMESVLAEGRRSLSTTESRAILSAFGIPTTPVVLARSATEALVAAESLGYPVVMKVCSPDLRHKSDVNGVRLNINSAHTVRNVYHELLDALHSAMPEARVEGITVEHMHRNPAIRELMIGVVRDPVFGPVISFGAGGTAVEALQDQAVALPPLNEYMIRKTIAQTRVARMLEPFRQMPGINRTALEQVMQRVSTLVCELPEVVEMDINPLLVDDREALVVDARFIINYPVTDAQPYDHMAIHPYPIDLVSQHQLREGGKVLIRPIRPEDADIEQAFVRNLSGEARYMRFMQSLSELTPSMLVRFTQIDYDREMAFVALTRNSDSGETEEIGVSRIVLNPDGDSCEFALVVADDWRNRGLGNLLMQVIITHARSKRLQSIDGDVLAENHSMLKLMDRLGFERTRSPEDPGIVRVSKRLV